MLSLMPKGGGGGGGGASDELIWFLVLIIRAFDNQTEIWSCLSSPLIIKLFEMLEDNHDYFVYKTFTLKSNKSD